MENRIFRDRMLETESPKEWSLDISAAAQVIQIVKARALTFRYGKKLMNSPWCSIQVAWPWPQSIANGSPCTADIFTIGKAKWLVIDALMGIRCAEPHLVPCVCEAIISYWQAWQWSEVSLLLKSHPSQILGLAASHHSQCKSLEGCTAFLLQLPLNSKAVAADAQE